MAMRRFPTRLYAGRFVSAVSAPLMQRSSSYWASSLSPLLSSSSSRNLPLRNRTAHNFNTIGSSCCLPLHFRAYSAIKKVSFLKPSTTTSTKTTSAAIGDSATTESPPSSSTQPLVQVPDGVTTTTTVTTNASDNVRTVSDRNGRHRALQDLGIMNDTIRSTTARHGLRRRHGVTTGSFQKSNMISNNSIYSSTNSTLRPYEATTVRVKSIHAAQTLDVVKVLSKVFGTSSSLQPVRHMFGKMSVIVQLNETMIHNEPVARYVAVYRFGSVVFFNIAPRDAGMLLEKIKRHGSSAVSSGFERKEHFEVLVQPTLKAMPHVANGDFCVVQGLDMNATAVISNIMAQTVALDSYADTVDQLLANFADINSTVTRTGKFTHMERESLFRVVSQNNSVFIDMISKLGIKDRSETAWNLSHYQKVHEGMRDEFEIEDRFHKIEFKLNLIQQNAKFFLEMLHENKSSSLEWTIIVLIFFECVLMIMEMSGVGEVFFSNAVQSVFPVLPPKY